MPSPVRILGVDPGLNVTGYAVIESTTPRVRLVEAGIIKSVEGRAKVEMTLRLKAIHEGILEVIDQLKPTSMAVEQLYAHYAHPRTAILMGHARGAIFLAAAMRGLHVTSYGATRVKKTVTGSGRADKDAMQRAMLREFGLAVMPEPHDVADAMAIALCHHQSVSSGPKERGVGVRLSALREGDA